ncbi:MAG: hypothetical protein LBV71_09300 [Prevotella sp.]|jgi:O-antigen/teichoic acid export membrane protein|nr:hypothetical protein [Prevotella sp.]
MELDELKNTWQSLDDRLQKQEVLKRNIMKEMLYTKSDKALSRLFNYEIFGIIVLLLVIPAIIYALNFHPDLPGYKTFMYIMLVVDIVFFFWQVYKVYGLMQVDFSRTVSTNIQHTNKYNIHIKKEKLVMLFFVPLVLLSCAFLYARLNVNIVLWTFLTCTAIGLVLLTIWSYKKLYDKNIKSILQSLDNLKELEEEE